MDDPLAPALGADADSFRDLARARLEEAGQALDRFKALAPSASFEDVLEAWDSVARPMDDIQGVAGLFFQVHPDADVRATAAEVEQELSRFATELSLDQDVFRRFNALDPGEAPGPVTARIVEHALRDFRRAGVDQDERIRDRVRQLRKELVEIGQQFARNIASDVRTISIPEGHAGLGGVPEDYLRSHPEEPDGSVTISTDPTDYVPFMKYCRNASHREALYRQYASRASPGNLAVLDQMMAKRHELATLLGYEHWAAYITEDKMIKTADRVASFIDRITGLTGDRMAAEVGELLKAVQSERPGETAVREFDRAWALERVRARKFGFDAREMRSYLAYDRVKQGVLDTASRLFGVEFRPAGVPVWLPEVEAWNMLEDGELTGRFFLDMHSRPDKFKHAAMFDLAAGQQGGRIPQACLVCNFPRPGAGDDGLLEPDQLRTFFHEFGHLMHHLLAGRQRWLAVSGIATEWDFVEVPSQLFEEWSRDADVLAQFALHHLTEEPVPASLVQCMNRAVDYGKGVGTRVQMYFASLSLEYFRCDPVGLDSTRVMRELKERFVPFPHEEGTTFQTAFGHLDGYSALYYTYMWSLVLAKDVRQAFGDDLMDPEVARRYRQCILEPGGSRDAEQLVEEFLGRPFGFGAFETWLAA